MAKVKKAVKKVAPKKTTSKKPNKTGFEEVKVGTQYWKPEKIGDTIEGTFVRLEERPKYKGKKGETQNHVVLKNEEGDEIQAPSHWELESAVNKKGEGYYIFELLKKGGALDKKTGKNSGYHYDIHFKA